MVLRVPPAPARLRWALQNVALCLQIRHFFHGVAVFPQSVIFFWSVRNIAHISGGKFSSLARQFHCRTRLGEGLSLIGKIQVHLNTSIQAAWVSPEYISPGSFGVFHLSEIVDHSTQGRKEF